VNQVEVANAARHKIVNSQKAHIRTTAASETACTSVLGGQRLPTTMPVPVNDPYAQQQQRQSFAGSAQQQRQSFAGNAQQQRQSFDGNAQRQSFDGNAQRQSFDGNAQQQRQSFPLLLNPYARQQQRQSFPLNNPYAQQQQRQSFVNNGSSSTGHGSVRNTAEI
jgi:hypothetical protein